MACDNPDPLNLFPTLNKYILINGKPVPLLLTPLELQKKLVKEPYKAMRDLAVMYKLQHSITTIRGELIIKIRGIINYRLPIIGETIKSLKEKASKMVHHKYCDLIKLAEEKRHLEKI